MKSPASSCNQQWAIIRRHFTVMVHYPFRSLLRVLLWPGLLIGLGLYLLRDIHSDTYMSSSFILTVPIFIKFATLCHIHSMADYLVTDKANEMKSLMISMGLSRINYYLAMAFCFIIFALPVVVIILVATKIYLVDDSVNLFTMLALALLFVLQLDALIAACVSFITSSTFSFVVIVIVGVLDIFLDSLAEWIIGIAGNSFSSAVLFIISYSPYIVIRLFAYNYADAHHPDVLTDRKTIPFTQPLYLLFVSQVFWILFFRLFAYWFEEVCPWQNVSAVRNFCFCFTSKRGRATEDVSSMETSGSQSKYFEQRQDTSHDVGIRISHVTKRFGNQVAVNDVSYTIYKGETTLLLGHNGAGKSTLMNIILGLLEPNDGYVKFKNRSGDAAPAVGVCPQASILDDDLTIKQHLELFNDIKSNISGDERIRHIHQTIGDVSLAGQEFKRPSELSGGMKRKLSLGIAFVGKSDVLILDEPSSGLDPDSRMFVWNAIRRYRSDRTVLLSTQHMEEADYLGDRIAIMSAGRIVCCGSSVYLNKLFGTGYKLRIECKLSKRQHVIDHFRNHYFDAIAPTEASSDIISTSANSDPIVDLVLALETKDTKKDPELELIKLLEDLENNAEGLSVRSYGLKSSSIEDVMLNTGKYFASLDPKGTTQTRSASGNISALTGIRRRSDVSSCDILCAMIIKHLQVYQANWLSVLFLKILLPILGAYLLSYRLKQPKSSEIFWQSPLVVLIIVHLIYFPSRERTSKFKIMQSTSSATIWIYWIAQILIDLVWMIVALVAINGFIYFSSIKPLVSTWELHGLITLATICFYLASMFQCYCLSNVFSNSRSSIGYLLIIAVISSAIGLVIYLLRLSFHESKGTLWMHTINDYFFMGLLPTDAYGWFLNGLPAKCYFSYRSRASCTEQSGSPIVVGLIVLCVQVVFYGVLLVFVEAQSIDIEWYFTFRNICPCFCGSGRTLARNREIDRDVAEETTKALTAIKDVNGPHALVAAQLDKSYIRNTKIIENLSFTVNKAECFGLLGVNGAGKTTTFSMLVTETAPDSGRILANGHYNDHDLHMFRKSLGFDPQATPDMSLTPYQALSLMARLRGVDAISIPQAVEAVVELLDMKEHTHKNDSKLSGGTKRKLALGMALIGNPALLTLDEPTAGVDPLARRSVWALLKSLRTQNECSIIISSHAMEECEAICDRIAIMARGQLRCIGTFLHLRSKFARGCTLRVQLSKSHTSSKTVGGRKKHSDLGHSEHQSSKTGSSQHQMHVLNNSKDTHKSIRRRSSNSSLTAITEVADELQQLLTSSIGQSIFNLADRNVNSVTFNITDNRVRRSILFRMMRDFRQKHPNVSYMINDASLEDIFISLAREQQDLEAGRLVAPVQA